MDAGAAENLTILFLCFGLLVISLRFFSLINFGGAVLMKVCLFQVRSGMFNVFMAIEDHCVTTCLA